jgi:hypothetical protein
LKLIVKFKQRRRRKRRKKARRARNRQHSKWVLYILSLTGHLDMIGWCS